MIQLLRPTLELVPSYVEFNQERVALGESTWIEHLPKDGESAQEFIARLARYQTTPDPGLVPETSYWATNETGLVGSISIRHTLNEKLKEHGGHIGYDVRPKARRQGYATEMLRQVLNTPKAQEIGRILITCAPDNIASCRAILANGGALTRTAFLEQYQRHSHYFWIDVT